MPTIHYLSDGKIVEAVTKQSILQASLEAEIPHAHACGGYARCSTCRVLVLQGLENCPPRNEAEKKLADRLHFSPRIRLACQTKPAGDVMLRRLVLDEADIRLTSQLRAQNRTNSVGEEKHVAILFADIRGFTAFTEARLPYDVVHALNRYFHEMGEVINRNGGYIDNYMGDGLMALFGVDDRPEATLRAVKAGFEMGKQMEAVVKPYFRAVHKVALDIGVGIHCGDVVVGTIGSATNKHTTAIGDAVNLASRVEAANKQMKTKVLISQDVYEEIREHIQVGRQALISLRGKTGEFMLHEVVGIDSAVHVESSERFKVMKLDPQEQNIRHEILKVLGGILLGLFFAGFVTAILSGQGLMLLGYTGLGLLGLAVLFWEFLLQDV